MNEMKACKIVSFKERNDLILKIFLVRETELNKPTVVIWAPD